jgi:hypothetical protein
MFSPHYLPGHSAVGECGPPAELCLRWRLSGSSIGGCKQRRPKTQKQAGFSLMETYHKWIAARRRATRERESHRMPSGCLLSAFDESPCPRYPLRCYHKAALFPVIHNREVIPPCSPVAECDSGFACAISPYKVTPLA